MEWHSTYAAIYRAKKDELKPVKELDEVSLGDLLGIESQKEALLANTKSFLEGKGFHHALLWGARHGQIKPYQSHL